MKETYFMAEVFAQLIAQLNSSVFTLLAILLVSFWGVFKIGGLVNKFSDHNIRVEKLESLSDRVVTIQTKVDLIYQHVAPNIPVKTQSPATLTSVGTTIATNIKADKILERYKENLVHEVEKLHPTNAYDIQQAAFDIAKNKMPSFLNETELVTVKNEAYENGLLLEDVMSIFGVLLRNHILHSRGISVADIDRHAPSVNDE